ncbi:GAF domain-containing protein [Aestuariibacter sp. GS-14]|uniref:HD family phosphohydrolase n=1 Tax=Aestuariibacter sp. GS-14 TaxID=2590670 RepID=UPI00112A601B|nr:HD family phosphohydrolase [Aestuariibacter sp. GS-14]TPV62236.1 GAF domain-containing protein [Aestuariibacter sp. GS-14]
MPVSQILDELLRVSVALSVDKNTKRLLETILLAAKKLANADGGTIYSVKDGTELVFDTLFNDSMNMHLGGSSDSVVTLNSIPIYINGKVNTDAVVAQAAATGEVINIANVSEVQGSQSDRFKSIDKQFSYQTISMLTIPMQNHEGDLSGVLQLVNAQDPHGNIIPFDNDTERTVVALASLASVALTNRQLIDNMEELFQAFTRLIAKAIDEKSPYTGGHCRRVPELTMMIAEAVHRHDEGPLASFTMTDADRHELELAGWIHDCGKVATPEYVMDKSKKLETVFDRIELVKTRFALAHQQIELRFTKAMMDTQDTSVRADLQTQMTKEQAQLERDLQFVITANTGGEFMRAEDQAYLEDIARSQQVSVGNETVPLLTDNEIYNLRTARGTLNSEERAIINRHMDITVEMLDTLPFPKHLARVPEFAGGHHEKMDGTGYPKRLTREQLSIPARIMAIADIFEALTAADRPYKDAKKISECLRIMGYMKMDNHIDPDLFDVFIKQRVYEQYAAEFLKPEQMDDIDLSKIPGFTA